MQIFSQHIACCQCDPNVLFFSKQMNKDKEDERQGKRQSERIDAKREQRGREPAGGRNEAGCDFNTWSSQTHYRLRSEERRGQT